MLHPSAHCACFFLIFTLHLPPKMAGFLCRQPRMLAELFSRELSILTLLGYHPLCFPPAVLTRQESHLSKADPQCPRMTPRSQLSLNCSRSSGLSTVQKESELRSLLRAVSSFSCCIAGDVQVGMAPALGGVLIITLQDELGVKGRGSWKAVIYDLVMRWRGQMNGGTT